MKLSVRTTYSFFLTTQDFFPKIRPSFSLLSGGPALNRFSARRRILHEQQAVLLHIAVILVPVPDPDSGFTGMITLKSMLVFLRVHQP
jgi:hypothetical protein